MAGSPTVSSHTFSGTYRRSHAFISMAFAGLVLLFMPFKSALSAEESSEPKSIRMTCGTCPSGYALTGVTTDATLCKEGDPTVVQCVPLGVNMLSVCGRVRKATSRSAVPWCRYVAVRKRAAA
jgi:hypothetical protein